MNNNNENGELKQTIEDIKESIAALSERQNSQYTEVMMALKGFKADVEKFKNSTIPDIPEEDLYEEAREIVTSTGKVSASFLQRRLKIGYARAARILDKLEADGIIGPNNDSTPRKILVKENS